MGGGFFKIAAKRLLQSHLEFERPEELLLLADDCPPSASDSP